MAAYKMNLIIFLSFSFGCTLDPVSREIWLYRKHLPYLSEHSYISLLYWKHYGFLKKKKVSSDLLFCIIEYWEKDVLPTVYSKSGWTKWWERFCKGSVKGNAMPQNESLWLIKAHVPEVETLFTQHIPNGW